MDRSASTTSKSASTARQAIAPAYLLMCLVLGGSAQGIWSNLLLQLAGLAIIAWAAMAPVEEPLSKGARQLFLIILAGLTIAAVQLIPLPSSVWPHLGGRSQIATSYQVLGIPVPSLTLSLAPFASFATLAAVIPALGMLCAIVGLKAYRQSWFALALLVGTFSGILLGAMQVSSGDAETSPWYLYDFTNVGFGVGFFANANHMASLLVIAVPFLAALLESARRGSLHRYSAAVALAAGGAVLIIVGIALNRSLAGYGLAIPVFAASLLIVIPGRSAARPWIAAASALLLAGAAAALALSPIGERSLGTSGSVQSREAINATTAKAFVDFLPFGSGLGTFKSVYKLYEQREGMTVTIVNHAHDDYAELALESGLPGIALIILFLVWWGASALRVWRVADLGPYARAASLSSAALLVHSLVDFPLRTAALSTCFAMCLGLLVDRRPQRRSDRSNLRPTRHVSVG